MPEERLPFRKYMSIPYEIEKKSHGNFVTTTDKMVEQELTARLHKLFPLAGVVAEESGTDWDQKYEYQWIIDPIDGTTNYIYGLPYAVSVALAHGNAENIILGVVYDPGNDVLYYGCRGKGSYVMERSSKRTLHVKPCEDDEGIVLFGMPYDRKKTEKIFDMAKKFYAKASDLKRIGPASLDICMVAAGKAKAYFELDLKLWDISAGLLILTEAGGEYRKTGDLYIFGSGEIPEIS